MLLAFRRGRTYEAQRLPEQEWLTCSLAPPPSQSDEAWHPKSKRKVRPLVKRAMHLLAWRAGEVGGRHSVRGYDAAYRGLFNGFG